MPLRAVQILQIVGWIVLANCIHLGANGANNSQSADATTLSAGSVIERELGPGEALNYAIWVEKGEFVKVGVHHEGVDLTLKLVSPTDAELESFFDGATHTLGYHQVSVIASASGLHHVYLQNPSETAKLSYVASSRGASPSNRP